ncbi:hypothetical protein GWK47_045064 [Chionoecetes opilio]|uniref:Uncharacterized protein n=1 Tax=Chionoecetes opilio TaxID=41210 RepID=A0A8J5CHU2_CHIOP|nr:hypothetical protein GWK47_045064 [Chionoecetes opilio]
MDLHRFYANRGERSLIVGPHSLIFSAQFSHRRWHIKIRVKFTKGSIGGRTFFFILCTTPHRGIVLSWPVKKPLRREPPTFDPIDTFFLVFPPGAVLRPRTLKLYSQSRGPPSHCSIYDKPQWGFHVIFTPKSFSSISPCKEICRRCHTRFPSIPKTLRVQRAQCKPHKRHLYYSSP